MGYNGRVKIITHGAAREVTGTCHEIQTTQTRILLDCGLFQGHRQQAVTKNAHFNFEPPEIDAMILTHAHGDHVGRVPLLWKRGFRGKIFCTHATRDLAEVMLQDAAYLQEKDEEYFQKHLPESMIKLEGPLYTHEDATGCMDLFVTRQYGEWFDVAPGIRAQLLEAGHILGAAMVAMEITENGKMRRVGFSGDLGRNALPIIRDPAAMPPVEILICESTYGNRTHETIQEAKRELANFIIEVSKRGGKMLIPAFSLERTQEIIYDIHSLWDEKAIPPVPIVIDSPLASRVTEVFMKHPECFDQEMYDDFLGRAHNPFQFSLVRYTDSVEESKDLNGTPGPMIIMAGSGMCEAGRIRHHLKNELENPHSSVVAVGYMAENTLGARLLNPEEQQVKIFDRFYRKKASIHYINAYSGHADRFDLDAFVHAIDGLKQVILVHGDPEQMDPFAQRLREHELLVITPEKEDVIDVG